MAKLPTVDDLGGRPVPQSGRIARVDAPNVGSGYQAIGQGIAALGDVYAKAKYNDDKLRAEDAMNQLQQRSLEYANGEDGYKNHKSGDVVRRPVYKDYLEKFNNAASEIASNLDNDEQRQFFERRAELARLQFGSNLTNHITREKEIYNRQVIEGGKAVEYQNATANYDKPGDVAFSVERTKHLVAQQAEQEGWPADLRKAKELEALSNLHTSVIEQAVANDNPEYAKEWYRRNKDSIEGGRYAGLEALIKKSGIKVKAQEVGDDIMNRGLDERSALDEVRRKYKGEEEEAIVSYVKGRFGEIKQIEDQTAKNADNEAWAIYAESRKFSDIPPTILQQMNGKTRESLRAYAEKEAAGEDGTPPKTETNWGVYYDLIRMAKEDPAKFKEENLLTYIPYLKDSHREQLMKMQADPQEVNYISTQAQIAKRALVQAGLDPKNTDKDNTEGQRIAKFYKGIDDAMESFQVMKGRKPDDKELTQIIDKAIMDKVYVDEWFGDPERPISTLTPDELEDAYVEIQGKEYELNQIPPEERAYVIKRRVDSGLSVTEKDIMRTWLIMKGKI